MKSAFEISPKDLENNTDLQKNYNNLYDAIFEKMKNGTEVDEDVVKSSTEALNEKRKKHIKHGGLLIGFEKESSMLIYEQLVNLQSKLPEHEFNEVAQGLINANNLLYEKGGKDAETK